MASNEMPKMSGRKIIIPCSPDKNLPPINAKPGDRIAIDATVVLNTGNDCLYIVAELMGKGMQINVNET